ncbi:delta-lactam-biosynthetic de-N-acetylase [Cellulosilyticum sp. I15G10I2]|uniref:delta-lactam-biosynthetic de-N-acetylase n=1 Tax=Cellulosilyticum sp. I15G10I2 TaxID=1892843 RepID=UPI00085BDC8B|nr:delta-lactam-biosynthetic de-N-acetylase [Cellulosilyticum sp. I15G10I2]
MTRKIITVLISVASLCTHFYAASVPTEVPPQAACFKNLDNSKTDWWFIRNKDHRPPQFNTHLDYDLAKYDGICLGDTNRQVVYLTFDEGYENGYTPLILDVLKEHDVQAMFFVTATYITANPHIIKRMADEGHIVGNHTTTHPSMPSVTDNEEKFKDELLTVANKYKEVTFEDMPPYFRPPMGHYSERSLAMTQALGYKTIFWSFAYPDWNVNKQPSHAKAKEMMLNGLHNGGIYLLHAVSKTNTEVLGDFIKEARGLGYNFELLP